MKKLFTAILVSFAVTASAQTAGVLIQPEFKTSNVRKGFFAQADIFKGIGVYSDFKLMNNDAMVNFGGVDYKQETSHEQLNVGLSYSLLSRVKALASASVLNTQKASYRSREGFLGSGERIKTEPTYQLGAMYSESFLSVMFGYEMERNNTNSRVSVGFGFNF